MNLRIAAVKISKPRFCNLEREYQRLRTEHPDIEELNHPYMNMSDALRAYFALADYFTDPSAECSERMLVGLRSADLLYSALARQRVTFGNQTTILFFNPGL